MATKPSGFQSAPEQAPNQPTKPARHPKGSAGSVAPDWERIELDYRAGIKTLRQIAEENGISHVAVNKRAKKEGWERDLSAKINAKADALVTKAMVTSSVTTEAKIAEKQVVDVAAQAVADIRLAHRKDIHRARRVTNALLDELEQSTDPQTLSLLLELGDIMAKPDEKTGRDRLNEIYQAVISLPERSKTMKVLAESLQKLVDMERAAFNMDKDNSKEADPLAALLTRIATGNGNGFAPVPVDPERESDPSPES